MEHSVPNVPSRSTGHGEIFAQAPLDLPTELADEVAYVQSSSLVLMSYSIERRRSFQDLLYRYFRQIRHGCKNSNCDFPSCRSYQKKTSKGPFRDFTNLSAWTLATFFATQDNAQRGLCSNEPAPIPHGPKRYLEPSKMDQNPTSIAEDLETPPQHGDVSGNAEPLHKKDYRSFTQNLFDTITMKQLRVTKSSEGFSEWQLGRNTAKGALSVDDRNDAIETNTRQGDDEPRSENPLQQELPSHERYSKAANSESSKVALCHTGLGMKSFMPGLWHAVDKRFSATFNVPVLASVGCGSQFTTELWRNYPRSLSRFTMENVEVLNTSFEIFKPEIPDEQKFPSSFDPPALNLPFASLISGTATRREREMAFLSQSIIFVLSSPDSLLKSFKDSDSESEDAKDEYDFLKIVHSFTLLFKVDSLERCVLSSLLDGANKLYPLKLDCPEKSNTKGRPRSEPLGSNTGLENSPTREIVLNDDEAIHIAKIALAALIARVSKAKGSRNAWVSFCKAHAKGRATSEDTQLILMDIFDDQLCIELMTVLVKSMVARKYVSENARIQEPRLLGIHNLQDRPENTINKLLYKVFHLSPSAGIMPMQDLKRREISRYHAEILLQWLRSVILKSWDGKARTPLWSAVGCALEFMSYLFQMSDQLGIDPSSFETPFVFTRLDTKQLPTPLLLSKIDRSTVDLLSCRFLFPRETLVSYFRDLNFASMLEAYNGSSAAEKLARIQNFRDDPNFTSKCVKDINRFLVLKLNREEILTDALNQLWRREGYELMRPLKVIIGGQEGEEGVDHGGVQQEFVRIAIGEWMRPDYGLFTTDEQTQMSWFQPFSLEPLYKFELLGLITALAVYNGLTLPVTFPLALYRKLLCFPVTRLEHIRDGWPSLANGLQSLLDWTDESVETVFARSYGFSVEAFGETIHIDHAEIKWSRDWPSNKRFDYTWINPDIQDDAAGGFTSSKSGSRKSSASSQVSAGKSDGSIASDPSADQSSFGPVRDGIQSSPNCLLAQQTFRMVTNENRDRYVEDYIYWLTDKSIRPQYRAFALGFNGFLGSEISMFSPEDLKSVVEGTQDIDVDELWHAATYDNGYSPSHRVIEDFWHVVRDLSPTQLRQLLEFVTASDRVPVKGLSSIRFVIQKNGDSDERLPTSQTCFGQLLLPEYSCRAVLKARLCTAFEHYRGFGLG